VGSEQLHAVVPLLRQALIDTLKAWPLSRDAPNWRADAIGFRADTADCYAPSMRQRIDLDRVRRQKLRALPKPWTDNRRCRRFDGKRTFGSCSRPALA
jgi:hypothetical protein